jgi:hypothetical protein
MSTIIRTKPLLELSEQPGFSQYAEYTECTELARLIMENYIAGYYEGIGIPSEKPTTRIRKPPILCRYRHLILEYNECKREEVENKFRKQFRKSITDYKPKTI